MSAEKVIYNLLSNDSALDSAAYGIYAGIIPIDATLPAIAYNYISGDEITSIGMAEIKMISRMQITVAAQTYPEIKTVIGLVDNACNHKQGTFNGVVTDSVIKMVVGPDFRDDDANIYYQTIDYQVIYNK